MNMRDACLALSAANSDEPRALARLGIHCFKRGNYLEAAQWLELASARDIPEAAYVLGMMLLNGIGVKSQPALAVNYIKHAADQGLKAARYTLGNVLFNGIGVERDVPRAMELFFKAVREHHPHALRTLGILHCFSDNDDTTNHAVAQRCLRIAAESGDAFAQYVLATHLLQKRQCRQYAEGLYWLQQASNCGLYCAKQRLFAERDSAFALNLKTEGFSPQPIDVDDIDPKAVLPDIKCFDVCFSENKIIPNVLSEYDDVIPSVACEYFMNLAEPLLKPSYVVAPETAKLVTTEERTNTLMSVLPSMYDLVCGFVVQRLAKIAGQPVEHAEKLEILHYSPDQQYKPHYDYFSRDGKGRLQELIEASGGQRATTVLAYLNDVQTGGETEFPRLGVSVFPVQGKVARFSNVNSQGEGNPDTLHTAKPIGNGEKWVLMVCFRDRPCVWNYDPPTGSR